jgi:dTDP-4-dehydrorhamnose 3,5-epimerase
MGSLSLDDILVTKLASIDTPGGNVSHALKDTDAGFSGFAEAYFSRVKHGSTKAWKCHNAMTSNLVVVVGKVKFVFCLKGSQGEYVFREEVVLASDPKRITVPPGIWFGFHGLSVEESLILNIADLKHDPSEVLRLDVNSIAYDWANEISSIDH